MNTKRAPSTLLGLVAAAGLALLAAGTMALAAPGTSARADETGSGPYPGYGPPPQAWAWHGYARHGRGGVCGAHTLRYLKHLDRVLPGLMEMSPSQEKSWDDLLASAETARDKVKAACGDRAAFHGTAPERMARMEAIMAAGLDGVRAVRPKFETFYAGLSPRQQEAIDGLMDHRGDHRDRPKRP